MTNPTNWPNPERPGVPLFPEQDGWHAIGLTIKQVKWWDAAKKYWWDYEKRYYLTLDEVAFRVPEYRYIGPVLTSTQIAEMLVGERERAAQEAIRIGESWNGTELSPTNTASTIAHAIRNVGDAL